MSQETPSNQERLFALLADRAVDGLPDSEARELDGLIARLGIRESDAMELAAAALMLGMTGSVSEELPASLQAKVESQAMARLGAQEHRPASGQTANGLRLAGSATDPAARRSMVWPAWLAAAACLALAVAGWWPRLAGTPAAPSPAERLAALEKEASDAMKPAWSATADPAAKGATGGVVWSDSRQQGFMKIAGLQPNDPGTSQYQLWIFTDPNLEPHPVDGGVFDIPANAPGEVVIPIDPKIQVSKAAIFAVTVEKPGGTVVSGRQRIVLLAKAQG